MKKAVKAFIIIALFLVGVYIFVPSKPAVKTASSGITDISKQTTSKQGTTFLIGEFQKELLNVNKDLQLYDVKPNGNFVYTYFKCFITDNSVKNFLDSQNISYSGASQEQLKLLKIQMQQDCESANSVLVNKGLVFIKSDKAVLFEEITPSIIVDELEKRVPTDVQSKYKNGFLLLKGVFQYNNNLNTLLSTQENKNTLKSVYSEMKVVINKSGPNEARQLMDSFAPIIDYYTK